MEDSLELRRICRENGLPLNDRQMQLFGTFVILLREWNAKVNLVSRKDEENIWFSHLLHSLAPWFYFELPPKISVLDLGSGGGFPGIPLAIVRSDVEVTLLDSVRKKTAALADMRHKLALENVQIVTGRAEEIGRGGAYAGYFDLVIARAVAPLSELIRWSRPFIRKSVKSTGLGEKEHREDKGRQILNSPALLALKGGDLEEEIRRAVMKTGNKSIASTALVFSGSHQAGLEEKHLVIVKFP